MSIIDTITNIGRGVKDFFASDTVRTIADGAKTVLDYMKERSADVKGMGQLTSLGDPNTQLGGQVAIRSSRSRAGTPGYGDIQEATFYKYAQLQNTVRYLYSQKSRYKSIAKDRA
tara:strand:+ start:510 stop:854 length:345 start_codon:yes stop_codon:yes gene_type:complete